MMMHKNVIPVLLLLMMVATAGRAQNTVSVVYNDSTKAMKHNTEKALRVIYGLEAKTFVYPVQLKPLKTDSVVELDPARLMKYYPQAIKGTAKDTFYIDYTMLIPLLVESIKDLEDQNNRFRNDISELKTAIANQKIAMQNMQNLLQHQMSSLDSEISSFRGNFLKPKPETQDSTQSSE